jgi:hypothetical protein
VLFDLKKGVIIICDICLHTPCHPRCPNAPDPPIVFYCDICNDPIYEGDDYYDFGEEKYCYDCVQRAFRTAEIEE